MTAIDEAMWKKIEKDDGRPFPVGLRKEINEIVAVWSYSGSKDAVGKEWSQVLTELENVEKLAASLIDRISAISFNSYKMIYHDDESGACARRTSDDMARIVAQIRQGIARHKESKTHTQKKSSRQFLDGIVRHIDEAYTKYCDGQQIKRSWVPGTHSSALNAPWKYATPPWVFAIIWCADNSVGNNPSAIDKSLGRHIKSRKSISRPVLPNFKEGDAFKWGDRYLVITDILGAIDGCDIITCCDVRKTVLGGALGYEEILFSELAILEAVPTTVER